MAGPPPPPPPPPPLPTILPPRRWKTENAPRRDNHPTPPSSRPSRPHVDAATLQHAAARLRKTEYGGPLLDYESCVSNGRLDGENQSLPGRDRKNSSLDERVDVNPRGPSLLAASDSAGVSDPLGDLRGWAHPLISQPAHSSSFSSSPIASFPPPLFANSSTSSSSYTTLPSSTFSPPPPMPSNPLPPPPLPSSLPPPLPSSLPPPLSPPLQQNSTNNNYFDYEKGFAVTRPVEYIYETRRGNSQWNSERMPLPPPPLNRQQRGAANHKEWVEWLGDMDSILERSVARIPAESPLRPASSSASSTLHSDFATQLRDDGLTSRQREASRFQKSNRILPTSSFDNTKIRQEAGRDTDEISHLMQKMERAMESATSSSPCHLNSCVSCHEAISADKPGCTALSQVYHVACFVCAKCSKQLAGASFYNVDGEAICEVDYQASLERCSKCSNPIEDKLLRACGGAFHVHCFTCVVCSKQLDGIPFTVDGENRVHCVACFHEVYAPRCAACSKPIVPAEGEKESVRVVAMDKSYHVDCYKCEDCGLLLNSKIEGQGCYPLDSHLYCKTCNGNRLRLAASTA